MNCKDQQVMTNKTVPRGTGFSLGLPLVWVRGVCECVCVCGGGFKYLTLGDTWRGTACYGRRLGCNMVNCTVSNNKNISKLCRWREILSFGFLVFLILGAFY